MISLNVEPKDVLGVTPDATLDQIRDAYRLKAKRHHPDAGGEDWAFKLVVQAYEALSTARVARATEREEAARPRAPYAHATAGSHGSHSHQRASSNGHGRYRAGSSTMDPPPASSRRYESANESVRKGVQEGAADPLRVVEVEKLSLRYQAEGIWLITERSSEEGFLSCSLNLNWPGSNVDLAAIPADIVDPILHEIGQVFDAVDVHSKASSSNASVVERRFNGWLSYPDAARASEAFVDLKMRLHTVGLAVNQWSRDLVVPRQGR